MQIAIVAGVLLVAVVAIDVAFHASISLEVDTSLGEDEEAWETIATLPTQWTSIAPHGIVIETNRSQEVPMRIVIDNERPLAFEETYELRAEGRRLAQGTLQAPSLGTAEETLQVPASDLLGERPQQDRSPRVGVGLELIVGDDSAFAWVEIVEVSR